MKIDFDLCLVLMAYHKKRGFVSTHDSIVLIRSLSVDWLKTLNTYIAILKKQLSLMSL